MATEVRLRRGTTAQHATFTGAAAEITVDTDKDTVVVHDGVTVGGFALGKESVISGKANVGANSDITSLSGLTTPLSVAQGGTAANTAAGARTALGAAASGALGSSGITGAAASGSNSDITNLTGLTTVPDLIATSISAAGGQKNIIYNGGCRVQAGAAVSLSTTPQYGKCDMWAGWASGGAVSAGTVTLDTASAVGSYGTAMHLSGVTLTGSGVLSIRQRIPAADAVFYKNKTVSFSSQVLQDSGGALNYVVVIRKPTAKDNYASATTISTSGATSVPNAANTSVNSLAVAMGDCSNGIEIEIQVTTGAITTKNFRFSDMQLEVGSTSTSFENTTLNFDIAKCGFLYEKTYDQATDPATATRNGLANVGSGGASDGAVLGGVFTFKHHKRSSPTVRYWDGAGTLNRWSSRNSTAWIDGRTLTAISASENGAIVDSATSTQSVMCAHFEADCRL